ncbi:DUF4346 domain-containing protein [Prochlorococcus sp. MIT 1341]|uniref:DUF4346 domain-containing protein n=1 Tax=Prochlorococcus sp. MIT 1341 TaxID=3096221 RepID=UPI0039BFAC30
MSKSIPKADFNQLRKLDDELSKRFISLDPRGYFLIRVDYAACQIIVEHYSNNLDDRGRAVDPETGELLACRGGEPRKPIASYRAISAKQMGIKLTEGEKPYPLGRLDHALYMGRELQRAENCLVTGEEYVQD